MELSAKAQGLIDEMGRQQGLPSLAFDGDGAIAIRFDGRLDIAIGYNAANDALFFLGVVDPAPDLDALDAWAMLGRNTRLADRRTRLALDPASSALTLICDHYVAALDDQRFAAALDAFVRDLEAQNGDGPVEAPPATAVLDAFDPSSVMIFRL